MALKITTDCINCAACEPECPNGAIFEGEEFFEIKPDLCSECIGAFDESQCTAVCPIDCIEKDPDYVETTEELMSKFKKIHKQ